MRLLVVTQIVDKNDSVLGFFHRWLEELASHCEAVVVVCLREGEHSLPDNVRVLSLGKEQRASRARYVARLFQYTWRERAAYQAVFVHMNPEYIVLCGWLWRAMGKRIVLWYTHKAVNWRLRCAVFFAHAVCTASQKSLRLTTVKTRVMGHGIDVEQFVPSSGQNKRFDIVMVGRISATKNQAQAVGLMSQLRANGLQPHLHFFGAPLTDQDEAYHQEVRELIRQEKLAETVFFHGPISHHELPHVYQQARLVLNLSSTGSLDKDVLEAMACNVPVVTTNDAFTSILPHKNIAGDSVATIERITGLLRQDSNENYREIIVKEHSLSLLMQRIISVCAE